MALRPPSRFDPARFSAETVNPLDHEIAAEKASALGRAGLRVEEALARLRASPSSGAPQHHALLADAADAVWAYFVQRELCGLRRHHDAIREYEIPAAVLARLGAR